MSAAIIIRRAETCRDTSLLALGRPRGRPYSSLPWLSLRDTPRPMIRNLRIDMKIRLITIIAICLSLCACHKSEADNASSNDFGSQTAAVHDRGENTSLDESADERAPSSEATKNHENADDAAKPSHPCEVWFKDAPKVLDNTQFAEASRMLQSLESGSCEAFGQFSQKYGAAAFPDSKLPLNGDMRLLCRYFDLRLNHNLPCLNDRGTAENNKNQTHGECDAWCSDQWLIDKAFHVDSNDPQALCQLAENHLYHTPYIDNLGNPYRVRYDPGFGSDKDFHCSHALDETWNDHIAMRLYRRSMQIAPLQTAYIWITHNTKSFEFDEAQVLSIIAPLLRLAESPDNGRANLSLAGLYAGGFGVLRDTQKSAEYLEKAFKSSEVHLFYTELAAILEALSRPARDAHFLETDDKSRRQARSQFLAQVHRVIADNKIEDPLILSATAIAILDAALDLQTETLLANALENRSTDLQCLSEPGTAKPAESCNASLIQQIWGRTIWKRLETLLLTDTPIDDKSVQNALAQAFANNPGGYFAAEFVADVLTNSRFGEDAQKLAYSVIQRDPTGTAAMTVVKISWLYPGLINLPKSVDDYFKLAADKSLAGQYGSHALEYGLYLLGMPLHQPIAQKGTLRFALKPAVYNSYNGSKPLCIELLDPWCHLYGLDDFRLVRHAGWNRLWTIYRQIGDIDWQFMLNCLEAAEIEFGSDSCEITEAFVPSVCLQNTIRVEKPDIEKGKRYIKQAIELSHTDRPRQFFEKLHQSMPERLPQTRANAGIWQQTLFTRLAFERFLSELGYNRLIADDEEKPAFELRLQKALEALRNITK